MKTFVFTLLFLLIGCQRAEIEPQRQELVVSDKATTQTGVNMITSTATWMAVSLDLFGF